MRISKCCRGPTARRVGTLGVLMLLAGYGFWGAVRGEALAPQNTQMELNNQRIVAWSSQIQPVRDQLASTEVLGYFAQWAGVYSNRRAIMSYVLSPHRLVDRRFTRWMLLDLADDAAVTRWTQEHGAVLRIRFDAGLAWVERKP